MLSTAAAATVMFACVCLCVGVCLPVCVCYPYPNNRKFVVFSINTSTTCVRARQKEVDRQSELKFAAFEYHKMHTNTYIRKHTCTHKYVYVLYICTNSIYTFVVVMPNTYANCNLHSFIEYNKYYDFTFTHTHRCT